ncbi:MAG: heme o synthase [Lautropia sp.]|nr:heme o synthase [Lautropia sp.]
MYSLSAIRQQSLLRSARHYYILTKPRIVLLAMFCSMIGMFMAPADALSTRVLLAGNLGIGLLAAAGFAFNCLVERRIDAVMWRTAHRGSARGEVSNMGLAAFALALGTTGAVLLHLFVNTLTLVLTLLTFVGYAVVYTVLLKPRTPQNIVIGGASGAMPPVLGWAAVTGEVSGPAIILFLIIFVWTPPHFWSLALYRAADYRRSGLPMLPVTHGPAFTRLNVFLYTVVLTAVTLMPYVVGMSGLPYLVSALLLDGVFLLLAWRIWRHYSDALARKTFGFSILYLALLFGALLIDHHL